MEFRLFHRKQMIPPPAVPQILDHDVRTNPTVETQPRIVSHPVKAEIDPEIRIGYYYGASSGRVLSYKLHCRKILSPVTVNPQLIRLDTNLAGDQQERRAKAYRCKQAVRGL